MTYGEFLDWEKFYLLEPFLPERVDLAGALVTSMVANVNRGKNSQPTPLSKFLLIQEGLRKEVETAESREEVHFLSTMLALGGRPRA